MDHSPFLGVFLKDFRLTTGPENSFNVTCIDDSLYNKVYSNCGFRSQCGALFVLKFFTKEYNVCWILKSFKNHKGKLRKQYPGI